MSTTNLTLIINEFPRILGRMQAGAKNKFRIDGNVVWIKLTQGKETCVDLADWPKVAPFRWCAANQHGRFYAIANLPGRGSGQIQLHRLLMSTPRGFLVDHSDGDSLNNRRKNLRTATPSQNAWNRKKRAGSKNLFIGVSRFRGENRWVSKVRIGGWNTYIGTFNSPRAAALAYDLCAIFHFGEFARLNFPIAR